MLGLGLGVDKIRPVTAGGLLDLYPATAAYSLRALSSTTTNVVRVREDGTNTEQDFTAKEITDGTLASFCGGNNGFVVTWYDQAGSNNATQATAGAQPKIYDSSTGVVLENGKAALDFDGTKELKATGFSGSAVQDTYFVLKGNTGGDQERMSMYDFSSNSFNRYSYFADLGGIGVAFEGYGTPSLYINGDLKSISNRGDVYTEFITGNQFLRVDQSADTSTWQDISFGFWFTSFGWIGTFQEIIIYQSDQSANRIKIENLINSHYNIYS